MNRYKGPRPVPESRPKPAGVRPGAGLVAFLAALCWAGPAAAQPREVWKGQPDYVRGLAVSPDGKTLIMGGPKTGVLLYDLGTGKPSEPLDLGKDYQDIHALALSPDGKTLAVATRSNAIVLWDMEKKAVRATVPAEKGRGVRSL